MAPTIAALRPDVLVLPESPKPTQHDLDRIGAESRAWRGIDPGAGLGVVAFGDYQFDGQIDHFTDGESSANGGRNECEHKWVVPVDITGPGQPFHLLAVWADNSGALRPVTAELRNRMHSMPRDGCIVAGDFNHNCKWDHKRFNEKDHRVTVELLEGMGLASAYHRSRGLKEHPDTVEPEMTYWTWYQRDRGHHIDFVYAPEAWIRSDPASVQVGRWEDFTANPGRLSDHAPVTADLDQT